MTDDHSAASPSTYRGGPLDSHSSRPRSEALPPTDFIVKAHQFARGRAAKIHERLAKARLPGAPASRLPDRPAHPGRAAVRLLGRSPGTWQATTDASTTRGTVAGTLARLGRTSLTIVRGGQEPYEAPEDRQVLRSTVLHISPHSLRRSQWVLPDGPFHLGNLPIAWQISARTDKSCALAQWPAQ